MVGDYRVRVGRVRVQGALAEHVASLVRVDRYGEHEVIRGYGNGDAMALRDLRNRVRMLLGLVDEAGMLALKMEEMEGKCDDKKQ